MRGPLRLGWLPLLLVLAASASPPAGAAPSASTPLAISYSGEFDLANAIVPQGTPHSYTYHVEWGYTWSGTWGELFETGGQEGIETSFGHEQISGSMHAVWRDALDSPLSACTLRIVPEMGDFPSFRTGYSAAAGTLTVGELETPTSRYGSFSSTSNPMCGGGPEIDIFGQPLSWSPLGPRSLTVPLAGGTRHFDRTWAWTFHYHGGVRRVYASSLHATLLVRFGA